MTRIAYAILLTLFAGLAPAQQEVQDTWLDGEALMLDVLNLAALEKAVLEPFHRDCRIVMDSGMTRHIENASGAPSPPALSCREPRHWEAVRQYVSEFRNRNDITARFMRPSGIGAPWMVRYALRCRRACHSGTIGFEIRFTYDGKRVTRVALQAR